jgi:hypothetical protein
MALEGAGRQRDEQYPVERDSGRAAGAVEHR